MRRTGNPGRVTAVLLAVALWLSYGAAAEKWPAIDIANGLGANYLFGHESDPVARAAAVRWRAIDGDTIAAVGQGPGHERVRVLGIDTPELHPCRCTLECDLGQRARRRLQELLDSGPVFIEATGRDRYGRTLAHVQVGGRDASAILIAEGLGRRYGGGRRRPWCG